MQISNVGVNPVKNTGSVLVLMVENKLGKFSSPIHLHYGSGRKSEHGVNGSYLKLIFEDLYEM